MRCSVFCAVRHADASPSAPGRCATAVLYLNPETWDPARDGGELRLYPFGACAPVNYLFLASSEQETAIVVGE